MFLYDPRTNLSTPTTYKELIGLTGKKLGKVTGYKAGSMPVVMVDSKTLEIIDEFRSAREAGRKCNYSYQAILDRSKNKYPYKNEPYVFMFEKDYIEQYGALEIS
ncbi:hypothetical protein OEV98_11095 [Caldibacillus lycopersici]|uniref:Uncharacterized protein n=1 Tax=Perspicuibacillus lycopersici TaxID=1325689 RepID=A0AAE3IVF9_9BACI|nr:hypothetical protein [Perspicuibacillus lycopersici]MCU9614106.1 hypothetical protein [Perspicuibacillus lycopersici]